MVKNLSIIQETPVFNPNGLNAWVGKIPWRRKWQPTPVFLPGESHGQRSLVSYSPWGHKESDTTEQLTHTHPLFTVVENCITIIRCWLCEKNQLCKSGGYLPKFSTGEKRHSKAPLSSVVCLCVYS